ncbi:MAG TPA: NAD-dependent epimerase/dehydratase family protein [Streptosporangiaceae bacterium]|nr:NAD-dependent epimerase/dehydratase family protein [Streptosporangiaceae bacterium]
MARVVLITGVSGYLGAEVAAILRDEPGIERLIEVAGPATADTASRPRPRAAEAASGDWPQQAAGQAARPDEEVVRLDVRTNQLGELIKATAADTVVHLGLATTPGAAGGRASMKETNVVGAMQLLIACQRSPTVRKLVVRSSTAVYGTSARNPTVFTEDMEPRASHGLARDVVDVEGYVRGLARRRPDIAVSVLRFVNFLGHRVDSPLTRYFMLPVTPTVLGHDPRIQFVDLWDGVEVVRRVVAHDHPGIFNVTGRGAMYLSQCLRRGGRVPVPMPGPALDAIAGLGFFPDVSPEQRDLLRYGRVVDGTKLERELGWAPRRTTEEAFAAFVADRGLTCSRPVAAADGALAAALDALRPADDAHQAQASPYSEGAPI